MWPLLARFGRLWHRLCARAGVEQCFGQGDGSIPAFETEFAKHTKGQATNGQIPGISSGRRNSVLVHRFEMPGRLVHTLFKVIRDYLKLPDLRFSSITGEFVRDSLVGVGEEWLRVES